jgi:hypothetical protein
LSATANRSGEGLLQTADSTAGRPPHDIAAGFVPTAIAFILAGTVLLAMKTSTKSQTQLQHSPPQYLK